MAEALKTFREGEDILASETNENNQFLLSKLSDNAAQVQQYVEGEVATIKSNVASVQATLQNNIDELDEKVNKKIVVVETFKEDNKWCRVWSDNWCEQGGNLGSGRTHTVSFIKPFADMNYTATASCNSSVENAKWQLSVSRDSVMQITLRSYDPCSKSWYACGFIK